MLITAAKDFFEDYKRHKSDREENLKITEIYNSDLGEFKEHH